MKSQINMNALKFKKYFKKIKSFEEWIDNQDELSAVERDLLLDYIKKMYESVLESGENTERFKKHKKKKKVESKQERIPEIKEEVVDDEPFVEEEKDEVVKVKLENKEEPEVIEDTPQFSDEFLELFEDSNSNDLSEKLSRLPIKDLKKAFGINEKIFTVKELFNGKSADFDKVIGDLDKLNSLEEAKSYIFENVASQYGWDEKNMVKKVKQFIKTVKRRYF